MEFEGISAVISGGASGLGAAVARKVVAGGGKALLLDLNEELGEALAAELGAGAAFRKANVTSEAQIDDAFAFAVAQHGGVQLVVSCAGIIGNRRVLGRDGVMPLAFYSNVIQVNLIGTFNLARAGAAAMQNNPENADGERGVIVNTASVAAYEGQIGQAAYASSKGGVAALTLPLAREYARLGIRVMAVAPGLFMTPMVESLPEAAQQSLAASIPFPNRLGQPGEYAELVAAIVANPMLNGEVIRLDGAIRMQPK